MIDDLEKSNDPTLADNEIASLMKTLASNKYQEIPGFPKKSTEPFKPLSFQKIASKADKRDLSKESKVENEPQESSSDLSDDNRAKLNNEGNSLEIETEGNMEELTQKDILNNLASPPPASDQSIVPANESAETLPKDLDETQDLVDQTDPRPLGLPIKEKLYTEEEKEIAYQKGLADAKNKLQTEQETQKNEALQVLEGLIKSLEKKVVIDTAVLEIYLKKEVLKIAAERAGSNIKEQPKEFVQRVEKLVQIIKDKGNNPILKLNPGDYKAVATLLKNSSELTNFTVNPDNHLQHGDIIIELGGVSVEDIIYDQYSSHEKSKTQNLEIANKDQYLESSDTKNQKQGIDQYWETFKEETSTDLKRTENLATTGNESIPEDLSQVQADLDVPNTKPLSGTESSKKSNLPTNEPIEKTPTNDVIAGMDGKHQNDQ